MHGTIIDNSDNDHNSKSYRTQITKMDRVVTRTARHLSTASILAEQYHKDQMSK